MRMRACAVRVKGCGVGYTGNPFCFLNQTPIKLTLNAKKKKTPKYHAYVLVLVFRFLGKVSIRIHHRHHHHHQPSYKH